MYLAYRAGSLPCFRSLFSSTELVVPTATCVSSSSRIFYRWTIFSHFGGTSENVSSKYGGKKIFSSTLRRVKLTFIKDLFSWPTTRTIDMIRTFSRKNNVWESCRHAPLSLFLMLNRVNKLVTGCRSSNSVDRLAGDRATQMWGLQLIKYVHACWKWFLSQPLSLNLRLPIAVVFHKRTSVLSSLLNKDKRFNYIMVTVHILSRLGYIFLTHMRDIIFVAIFSDVIHSASGRGWMI